MENPPIKIGVNVFVFRDGKLLLGKRIGKVGNGSWCLPGGHIEFGEHLSQAASRELEEEMSIKAGDLEFMQLLNQPREDRQYIHINFLAKDWSGEPQLTEPDKFSEWSWFDLDDLPSPIFEGHVQFIPAFKEGVRYID